MKIRIARLLTSATMVALAAAPLTAVQPDPAQRAVAAYRSGDWRATEAAALEMLAEDTSNAQGRFFLAVALMHRGRAGEALRHLDQAEAAGYPVAAVEFRRACALSVVGRVDDALAALRRAAAAGFAQDQLLSSEPLLAPVRSAPGFPEVSAAVDAAKHPCRHDPRYRQFDFWVGTWDVRPNGAPDSTPPSENVITLDYADCVVMEHWTGTSGVTGSSFNIYDSSRGEWYQVWVDSTGGLHEYHGNPDGEGNMLFEGTTPGAPGQPARVPTRLSFFRLGPDRVRQLSESPAPDGESWTVNYDLIYVRRPGTSRP